MRITLITLALIASNIISGQEVTTLIHNSGVDDAIIMGPDGHLYGSRYQGSTVRKIDLKNLVSEVFSEDYNTPNGLAFRDGWLYMADNRGNRIYRIASDGSKEIFIDNFYNPSGLIFEPDSDTLIITSYFGNKVVKAGPDGKYVTLATGSMLDGPVGLCFDDKDQLYVGNFNDRLILRVDDNGDQTRIYQASGTGALGFITYAKGHIYGTLFNQHKIMRTDLSGNGEIIMGSTKGNSDGDASQAKFNSPNGIFASPSEDTLFISDLGSRNIRVITNFHPNNTATRNTKLQAEITVTPNPIKEQLSLRLVLEQEDRFQLHLMDASGQSVRQLFQAHRLSAGHHHFEFDIETLPGGNYFLVLRSAKGGSMSVKISKL